MKWFRSNIRHGTRLALLALAVQFVLSFGHAAYFGLGGYGTAMTIKFLYPSTPLAMERAV